MTHRSCFMQVLPPPQRAAAVGEGEVGGCHRRRAVPCHHAADGGPRRPRRAVAHAQVPRGTYPTRFFFRSPVRTCLTRCCVHSNRIESNPMRRSGRRCSTSCARARRAAARRRTPSSPGSSATAATAAADPRKKSYAISCIAP